MFSIVKSLFTICDRHFFRRTKTLLWAIGNSVLFKISLHDCRLSGVKCVKSGTLAICTDRLKKTQHMVNSFNLCLEKEGRTLILIAFIYK